MAEIQTYLYGKKFPNRIFVGGLPVNTRACELAEFFAFFGHVTETKVILDDNGVSKGYGFVTFQDRRSVKQVESMGTIYFKNKKINIGPAVKKEVPTAIPEIVVVPFPHPVPHANTFSASYLNPMNCNPAYLQPQPLYPMIAGDFANDYTNEIPWLPVANPVYINQSIPPDAMTSSSCSEEEIKVLRPRVNKRKEIPPRFLRK